jgi:hypothetical protein
LGLFWDLYQLKSQISGIASAQNHSEERVGNLERQNERLATLLREVIGRPPPGNARRR